MKRLLSIAFLVVFHGTVSLSVLYTTIACYSFSFSLHNVVILVCVILLLFLPSCCSPSNSWTIISKKLVVHVVVCVKCFLKLSADENHVSVELVFNMRYIRPSYMQFLRPVAFLL